MNFLWYVYFGGLADSISNVLTVTWVAGSFGLAIWLIAAFIEESDNKPKWWMLGFTFGCALIASVIPSSRVFYTAAAISAGREVADTDTGKKAISALNAWLDERTNEKK